MLKAAVKLFDVEKRAVNFSRFQLSFERLQMMVKIVFVTAHFIMDAPHLGEMSFRLVLLHSHKFQIGSFPHTIPLVMCNKCTVDVIVFAAGNRNFGTVFQCHRFASDADNRP